MPIAANVTRLARLLVSDPAYFLAQARKRARRASLVDYRLSTGGRAGSPVLLSFEVTHKCNLRCYMCDLYGTGDAPDTVRARADAPEDLMTEEDDARLFSEIARFRPTISLTGGEPLLVSRGLTLMRLARKHGLVTSVTTNGGVLARQAAELVHLGVDNVTVSIDASAPTHDAIRGVPGTFERAVAGIARLNAARRERGSVKPHVDINATICGRNHRELSGLVKIAEGLGVERLQFSHLWFWTPEQVDRHNRLYGTFAPCTVQNTAALDGLDVEALVEEVAKVRSCTGPLPVRFLPELDADEIRAYYRSPLAVVKRTRCIAPWLTARIMPNGDVIPCLDVKVGNVRTRSFAELWNGSEMRRFRRLIRAKGVLPGCLRCCKLFSF